MRLHARNRLGGIVAAVSFALVAALGSGLPPPWPRSLDGLLYPLGLLLGSLAGSLGLVVATLPADRRGGLLGRLAVGRWLVLVAAGLGVAALFFLANGYYGGSCVGLPLGGLALLVLAGARAVLRRRPS